MNISCKFEQNWPKIYYSMKRFISWNMSILSKFCVTFQDTPNRQIILNTFSSILFIQILPYDLKIPYFSIECPIYPLTTIFSILIQWGWHLLKIQLFLNCQWCTQLLRWKINEESQISVITHNKLCFWHGISV
jgi:hypothetical protein